MHHGRARRWIWSKNIWTPSPEIDPILKQDNPDVLEYNLGTLHKPTLIVRLLFLLSSFLLISPAVAQTKREKSCYVNIVKSTASKRQVVMTRTIVKRCACINNNEKLGLSTKTCPSLRRTSEANYNKHFKPLD